MKDFEKLGVFYLGREYDAEQGRRKDNLVLYESKDLLTHAVCVGMTGSGKTGLCIALLEEAALDRIPAIVIDPKGDKDLMACAKRACTLAQHPDRFVYFHPAFPEDSVRLDPLHNFNRPSEIASRISAISPSICPGMKMRKACPSVGFPGEGR